MKRIFESEKLIKLLWGSDSDLIALRWNPAVEEGMRVHSKNVIDVQLAFSSHGRRLGMARAIEASVPSSLTFALSDAGKDPSYYAPQAENKRCTSIPFNDAHCTYSMDDLHRIELILLHKPADSSSFARAKQQTERDIVSINSGDFLFKWLGDEIGYFSRKFGSIKGQKSVQFRRAVVHLKMVLPGVKSEFLKSVDATVGPELRRRGVVIPDGDLSFAGDN